MKALLPAVWLATTILLIWADKILSSSVDDTQKLEDSRVFFRNSEPPLDKRDEERSPLELRKGVQESASWMKLKAQDRLIETILSRHSSPEDALKSRLMPLAIKVHDDKTRLVEALTEKYGFKNVMLRLLDTGHSPNVQKVAEALLEAQIIKFYEDGYTAAQVFNELKISTNTDVLNDRFLVVLEGFLQFSNNMNPWQEHESLFSVLALKVEEGVLADSIAKAKVHPINREKAYVVEDQLVKKWIDDEELHPRILLEQLEMDQGVDKFLSLRLSTVAKYINRYNQYHPYDKFSLLQWSTETYSVGPMLKALKEAEEVKEKQHIATLLLNEQLETLLADDQSLEYVFDQLELKTDDLLIYKNPNIETLERYIELFNIKYPENQQNLPKFLAKKLDDGPLAILLATRIPKTSHDEKFYSALLNDLLGRWHKAKLDPAVTYFKDATGDLKDVVDRIIWHYHGTEKFQPRKQYGLTPHGYRHPSGGEEPHSV